VNLQPGRVGVICSYSSFLRDLSLDILYEEQSEPVFRNGPATPAALKSFYQRYRLGSTEHMQTRRVQGRAVVENKCYT
jgi:hypothetical protein